METHKIASNKQKWCVFKSYYVVWKRIVDPPDEEKKEEV